MRIRLCLALWRGTAVQRACAARALRSAYPWLARFLFPFRRMTERDRYVWQEMVQ